MTLMEELRIAIREGRCPPIFSQNDLRLAGISDRNYNLSNYDKKNGGAESENALVSRVFNGEAFYTFDEAVLNKLDPGRVLACKECTETGRRIYSNEEP